ncbi:hypothetical protein ED388_04580 [Muribaculaceae bacterium Isolate-007 (NCI)]|nr:hypothetical protein EEL42_03305 [Muribaculaceae bacterium Isolate-100 (HZI)]RXE66263.1 hypothetical protein ED388_04580 [Muribaculaceae bacterium Isolate-007 (NCI)]
MTYIELLNSFWDSTRFNPCSSNEATMYFYLLHQCNIRRWINPFEFKTRDLELMLGFTRATISAIRNKLKQRGLIEFGKGVGSGKAVYLICGAKITDKELAKKICVQSVNTKLNTMLNTTLNTNLNTTENSTLYIEEKRNKTKDNPPNPQRGTRARESVEDSLFSEKEFEKSRSRGVKAARLVEFSPPTPDEVRSYFLRRQADVRLSDWEIESDSFFSYYDSQGWVKSNGRKVMNWESLANDWILRKEKELKHPKQHEPIITTQRHTPEDTLADEQFKLAQRIQWRRSRSTFSGGEEPPGGLPK